MAQMVSGICELVLEAADVGRLERFYRGLGLAVLARDGDRKVEGPIEHDGGDRSVYVFDPEGNRVELWDYFEDGEGQDDGVAGLAA